MPDQNGPCLYDRDWKFDIAAAYYYDADNRERYARIRRLKTVWPDRPALWLSYGIVNAESTSGGVKHDYRLPMRPQHAISSQAYADSVAAWLAGGHTGFYQIMLFMDPTMKPGPMAAGTWITIEDLFNGSKSLDKGLDTVFRGLAETYRLRSAAAGAKPKLDLADDADLDGFSLEEKPAEDAATVRVKAERDSLRRSLVLERRLIDDVARLLSGMPFPQNEKPALLVGDIAATRGVFRLPAEFDALDSIEKLAAQPLDGYRFIAVAASDKSAYRDAAIDAVVRWLSTQPGVLCVQGWLSTAGAMPLAMPEAIDATFKSRWPWQDDITRSADGKIAVAKSPRARVIAGTAESPEAVVWRGDGMRGAVVFQFDGKDVGGKTTEAIGKELARLATAEKPTDRIGLALTEPAGLVAGKAAGLTAFAAGRHVAGERNVRGMDLLTGRVDPALGAARAAAIVGESYRGEFVAAEAGVCVLGDAPLEAVEKIEGGLMLKCSGLVRAVAPGGIKVEWTGPPPPEVSTADGDESKFLAWLLESTAPGVATLPQKDGPPVTFIRTPAAIKLRPSESPSRKRAG
jgi:cytochrome c551/c552